MKRSRSLLAIVASAIVVALTMRVVSGAQIGAAAPVGVGVASPNSPSATNKAFAGHSPGARSEFQEAVKSVAVHDPTGAVWQLYDKCIVLPDAKAFRDRMTTELITGAHEDFRSGLELKVGQADGLLAAPYADLCMDAFAWAAASDNADTLYRRGGRRDGHGVAASSADLVSDPGKRLGATTRHGTLGHSPAPRARGSGMRRCAPNSSRMAAGR